MQRSIGPIPPRVARRTCAVVGAALLLASCANWLRRAEPAVPAAAPASAIDASPVPARPADTGLNEHWHRGAFMQIDIRAYQDSDGDGVGDLKGLIRRLDYLDELGVRGLLLMPWQPGSGEGRGDALTDFRGVDPALGTLADVDELLRRAHAKGVGVVLDYPLNHASAAHPFFVDALRDSGSAFRDWFVWSADAPRGWDVRGRNPWHAVARTGFFTSGPQHYYGVSGAARPDFDFVKQPKVLEHHLDNLRFWLNRGVDGFRLLGTAHLIEHDAQRWFDQPESRKLASIVAQTVQAYPKRFVACDATEAAAAWAAACGRVIDGGLGRAVVQASRGESAAAVQALAELLRKADAGVATWISSPDASAGGVRLADELGGDAAAIRLAAATYLLLPGSPFLHYGEEVGQDGSTTAAVVAVAGPATAPTTTGTAPDTRGLPAAPPRAGAAAAVQSASPALRGPMSWAHPNAGRDDGFSRREQGAPPMAANLEWANAAAQRGAFGSIHGAYRDLLDLRNRRPSISRGDIEAVFVRGQVLGFVRVLGDERTLVVVNHGPRRVEVDAAGLPRRARVAPIYPRRAGASYIAQIALADAAGRFEVDMPPRSARVFDIEAPRRN
jgi:glycosidase